MKKASTNSTTDGQYKRCYADGGTGQHGSGEIKEKQGIIRKTY